MFAVFVFETNNAVERPMFIIIDIFIPFQLIRVNTVNLFTH